MLLLCSITLTVAGRLRLQPHLPIPALCSARVVVQILVKHALDLIIEHQHQRSASASQHIGPSPLCGSYLVMTPSKNLFQRRLPSNSTTKLRRAKLQQYIRPSIVLCQQHLSITRTDIAGATRATR